jgi:hypothetical protein
MVCQWRENGRNGDKQEVRKKKKGGGRGEEGREMMMMLLLLVSKSNSSISHDPTESRRKESEFLIHLLN